MSNWIRALKPEGGSEASAASSPQTIATATRLLGEDATLWVVATAARICSELSKPADLEHPVSPAALHLGNAERQGFESCLLTVLGAIVEGVPAPEIEVPPEAIGQVRLRVRQGASLDVILRTVWATQALTQDALLGELERHVAAERLGAEIRGLNDKLFRYVDVIVRALTESYEDERHLWESRLTTNRRRVVEAIVAGQDTPEGAEQILGIQLRHHHLVAVCRSRQSGYEPEREVSLARSAQLVSRRLNAASTLSVELQDETTVMIWSFPEQPPTDLADTMAVSGMTDSVSVSVGVAAQGAAGLRASYRTAVDADHVARLKEASGNLALWTYDEFALQTVLIGDDPERARDFTRRVLTGLLGDNRKTVDLRETLRHYMIAGRSRQVAAQIMHLAPNTVAYRVQRAEELLGRPTTEGVLELLVALELARCFPSFVR